MTIVDEQGRPEPPEAGSELEILLGFLDFQRATLEWKTRGLSDEQLRTRLPHPSEMTLAGLLHHIAIVENYWFVGVITQDSGRYAEDANWEWEGALTLTGEQLRSQWGADVDASRRIVSEKVSTLPDALGTVFGPPRRRVSLRWVLTHMIEEYARHNGHADLLREFIDGETGE